MRKILPYFSVLSLPLLIYLIIYAKYIVPTTFAQVAGSNYIYPSGNVGIGTTSPGGLLELKNNSGISSGTLRLTNGISGSTYWMGVGDSGCGGAGFFFLGQVGGSGLCGGNLQANLTIGSSGYIGIGTTSPQQKLDVNGYLQVDSTNGEGGTIKLMGNNGVNMHLENINGTFRLVNSPWNAQIFSVDQSGNVGASGNISSATMTINSGWSPAQAVSINSNQIWKSQTAGDSTLYLQWSNPGGNVEIGGQSGAFNGLIIPNGQINLGGGILQLNNGDMGGGTRIQFLNFNNSANGPAIYGANNGILYLQGSPPYAGQGASDTVVFRNHDGGTNEVTVDTSNGNITANGTVSDKRPWFIATDNRSWLTIPVTTWTHESLNTVIAGNSGGWYNPSTGYFTAPTSGVYFCSFNGYGYSPSNSYAYATLGCDGNAYTCYGPSGSIANYMIQSVGASGYWAPSVNGYVYLAAGHTIGIWMYDWNGYGTYGPVSRFSCAYVSS